MLGPDDALMDFVPQVKLLLDDKVMQRYTVSYSLRVDTIVCDSQIAYPGNFFAVVISSISIYISWFTFILNKLCSNVMGVPLPLLTIIIICLKVECCTAVYCVYPTDLYIHIFLSNNID